MLPSSGSVSFPDVIKTCYSTSVCQALRNQAYTKTTGSVKPRRRTGWTPGPQNKRQGRRPNAEKTTGVRNAERQKAPKDRFWDDLSADKGGGSWSLHINRSSEAEAPAAISSGQGTVLGLEESAELAAREKGVLGRLLMSKVELLALIPCRCAFLLRCLFELKYSRHTVVHALYVEDGLCRGLFEGVVCYMVNIQSLLSSAENSTITVLCTLGYMHTHATRVIS